MEKYNQSITQTEWYHIKVKASPIRTAVKLAMVYDEWMFGLYIQHIHNMGVIEMREIGYICNHTKLR